MLSMPQADLASFPGSTAQLFFACSKTAYFSMREKKLGREPENEANADPQ